MLSSPIALRAGGLLCSAALIGGLAGCSAEPEFEIALPTMAPDQSVAEACALSSDEVDRITVETEEQLRTGIERAADELSDGKVPALDFLTVSLDDAFTRVQAEITNDEVLSAVDRIHLAVGGFGEIERPENLLDTPGYVGSLKEQLAELSSAASELQNLCIVEGQRR